MWVAQPKLPHNIFAVYYCNILSAYYFLIFPLYLPGQRLCFFFANLFFLISYTFSGTVSPSIAWNCLNLAFRWFIFIWIFPYSPSWYISIINCRKKNKTHSHRNSYIRNTLPLDYLFFLIDICSKNLLYPKIFFISLWQNNPLLIPVYIRPLTHVLSYYDFIWDISLSTIKKKIFYLFMDKKNKCPAQHSNPRLKNAKSVPVYTPVIFLPCRR